MALSTHTRAPGARHLAGWRRFALDAPAMLLYLMVCYAASFTIGPLGRDYSALADPASLPLVAAKVVSWESHLFATGVAAYHLVNLILLYACMLLVYRATQLAVRGPAWLGTLAATLFMANPVHSESVLNLTGVADLLPCLTALLAAVVYMEHAERPRRWNGLLWLPLTVIAVALFAENVWLVLFALLHEACLGECGARRWRRVTLATLAGMAASVPHMAGWTQQDFAPAGMFAPLYFVFYPIGFLPENAMLFHQQPYVGWVAALATLGVVTLLLRKTRHPALTFGLAVMATTQLGMAGRFVDPVHLLGAGRLLPACAFFNIAFAGLCFRTLKHPKWARTIILATTILCVIFFGLQLQSVLKWREAARITAAFRREAQTWQGPRLVLPDYRYYSGAPLCLSDTIAYDTPFGHAVPHAAPLALNVPGTYPPTLAVNAVNESTCEVTLQTRQPLNAIPWPYTLAGAGNTLDEEEARVETLARSSVNISFRVSSKLGAFPPR